MTWPFENDTSAITKKLAKKSLKSEKRRNFMIIIAISLAAFLMSMCGTLFFAFQESQNNMATFQASYDNLTEDKIEKLRHQPEIEMVASLYNLGEIKMPEGYVVDPENKRKLLVDPDTAPIVKRIFELSKQGNSVHQIARTLCEDGVLIPRAYRAMKNGTLETSTGFKFPTDWVAKNVKMILENQVYLGHMVSHKTQTKSFKNKKPVAVPKEEWIIVRNTHEAIIDEETFELVQKFISVKKQPNKTGRPNIFVGLVKCPDCGRNMAFSNPNGREPRFRCRTYVRNSNLCTTHAISYEALQQIVMSDIQKHIKNMEALGDQFIQEMHELSEKGGSKKIKQFEKDLEVAEKRIAEIDSVIMKLFEQNALGKISDERFEKMSSAYESEQKELAQKRDELRTKIRAEEKKTQSTNQFLETIRKYETVTELNRSMLVELIDSIYVYQAEGTGKDRKQRVEINYRFLAGSQCGIA